MSATPPETRSEYSRGPGDSGRDFAPEDGASSGGGRARADGFGSAVATGILAGGLLGALLLLVAEFTTLFTVKAASSSIPTKSASTGSHHAYAMALIAVCAAFLCYGVWRVGSRP